MFKAAATLEDSSINIKEDAECVAGSISICVDNSVLTIHVRKFSNQKPWMNSHVRHMPDLMHSDWVTSTKQSTE